VSECVGFNVPPHQHSIGYFEDESFQSITCTGTDNLTRTIKRQNTQIIQNNTTQKVALVNSITDTLGSTVETNLNPLMHDFYFHPYCHPDTHILRQIYVTGMAGKTEPGLVAFLRHPARKRSGSIILTPEPRRGRRSAKHSRAASMVYSRLMSV